MNDSPLYTLRGFRSLHRVTRRLILTRFLRSIAQGAMAVDFTLYLRARDWSAPEVGLLLMAGGLAGAALSLAVGVTSDRTGRKWFLLIYEAGLAAGTALLLVYPEVWILVLTAALFGFGRGANGASGPFAPAEQAWLAQHIPGPRRGTVFSFNAALQFWGMGIGSGLAAVLPHLALQASGLGAYAPLFILNLVVAVINFIQILTIEETREAPHHADRLTDTEVQRERGVAQRENRALTLLTVVNMTNSLGVGLVAPLLPYWFNVHFGVGPAAIGPVYGLTFLLTGLFSLFVGKMTETVGLTKSIILPRLLGVVMMVAIPFAPSFALAAALYVLRSVLNRSSVGARQAFSVGLVRDNRRGFASSLNAVSWNVPAALGPALGGWMIGLGALYWPFLLASGLQLTYIVLFSSLLGRYDTVAQGR